MSCEVDMINMSTKCVGVITTSQVIKQTGITEIDWTRFRQVENRCHIGFSFTWAYAVYNNREELSINWLYPSCLTHWGRVKMDAISQTNFVSAISWMKMFEFLFWFPKGPINIIPALVQIMAWRRPDAKPLSEPMMVSLTTHICVTRPQWVKTQCYHYLSI